MSKCKSYTTEESKDGLKITRATTRIAAQVAFPYNEIQCMWYVWTKLPPQDEDTDEEEEDEVEEAEEEEDEVAEVGPNIKEEEQDE